MIRKLYNVYTCAKRFDVGFGTAAILEDVYSNRYPSGVVLDYVSGEPIEFVVRETENDSLAVYGGTPSKHLFSLNEHWSNYSEDELAVSCSVYRDDVNKLCGLKFSISKSSTGEHLSEFTLKYHDNNATNLFFNDVDLSSVDKSKFAQILDVDDPTWSVWRNILTTQFDNYTFSVILEYPTGNMISHELRGFGEGKLDSILTVNRDTSKFVVESANGVLKASVSYSDISPLLFKETV